MLKFHNIPFLVHVHSKFIASFEWIKFSLNPFTVWPDRHFYEVSVYQND